MATHPSELKRSRGRPRTQLNDAATAPVQALDRGLKLLEMIANTGPLTLSDVSLRLGLPASTVHRLLATLDAHGFVAFDHATQEWAIGIECFRTGSSFLQRTNLVEASRATLRDLMEASGETANLAIAADGNVVFISQVETHNPIRAFFRPGTRGPIHASGIGKAILSTKSRKAVEATLQKHGLEQFTAKTLTSPGAFFDDLAAAADRGWTLDNEERYEGMRCIAAPIFNAHGEAQAGLSISGPAVRFPDDLIAEFGPKVKRAAHEVTELIGGRAP